MLAERLGMTVKDLLSRISSAELSEWMANDALTAVERQHESNAQALKASFKKF